MLRLNLGAPIPRSSTSPYYGKIIQDNSTAQQFNNITGSLPAFVVRIPRLMYIVIVILAACVFLIVLSIYELRQMQSDHIAIHLLHPLTDTKQDAANKKSVVWFLGRQIESGYLNHVIWVFERIGFVRGDNQSDWDILWAHDYPFLQLTDALTNLPPHKKVNHFPGSGFITNKATLISLKSKYIPPAFKLPFEKQEFLEYAQTNQDKLWVQKSNKHRGIKIKKLGELDLDSKDTFVQQFIDRPFLIDKRKFDIGVYAILTSIDPLRVYIYGGDVLLRFCSKPYYPLILDQVEKYVVRDNYFPTWQMPSLKASYSEMSYTHKETLNAYLQLLGKDPGVIWRQIQEAIQHVYYEKEAELLQAAEKFKMIRNFFELVRFDFLVDENLNVFIMEVNMSPNLSSHHFPLNKLLYEQVLFNLLSLIGVTTAIRKDSLKYKTSDSYNMQVSERDIQVFGDLCNSKKCKGSCANEDCYLCNFCLTKEEKAILKDTYLEHINRRNCHRLIPEPLNSTEDKYQLQNSLKFYKLNDRNKLLSRWFQGKCQQDITWCH